MTKLVKGNRIEGSRRAGLTVQVTARYVAGDTIRDIADHFGRSYGFIHTIVVESGVPMRGWGGARRKPVITLRR